MNYFNYSGCSFGTRVTKIIRKTIKFDGVVRDGKFAVFFVKFLLYRLN